MKAYLQALRCRLDQRGKGLHPDDGTTKCYLRALWRRLGRRGTALILLALIDLTFAYFYLNPPPRELRSPSTLFLETVAPLPVWGVLWGVVGLVCLQQAFSASDKIGYCYAVVLKVLWALLHLGAAVFADLTNGYLYCVLWTVASGWVIVIATWPEPAWPTRQPPIVPTTGRLPPDR